MQVKAKLPWDRKSVRVAVVGDLILDEYLDGVVNRISPEAPVPVHLVRKTSVSAGGAANVARNIQLAGGQAMIMGVWGADAAADQLRHLIGKDGIDTEGVLVDSDRPTVRKTRVTANQQQLVRIDWEEVKPITEAIQDQLFQCIEKKSWDVLLLSDYGKGGLPREFVQRLIKLAHKRQRPVVIDPKGKDYSQYSGATLVTPNRREACEALGLDSNQPVPALELVEQLAKKYAIENILVTLGAEGMLGLEGLKQKTQQLPAVTREVFDVSGAGDTVIAIMALGLGSDLSLFESMRFANIAAGRVVEKWGTQPILRAELIEALVKDANQESFGLISSLTKICEPKDILANFGPQGKRKQKLVFTNGCFDLLHAGHVAYLEAARSLGHQLIVAVNSDSSVRRLKGKTRPIVPAEHRMRLLAGLNCVDHVLHFDEDTPAQLIAELRPDVLAKGADYQIADIVGADFVQSYGGRVERIAFLDGLSTSDIIKRIIENKGFEGV